MGGGATISATAIQDVNVLPGIVALKFDLVSFPFSGGESARKRNSMIAPRNAATKVMGKANGVRASSCAGGSSPGGLLGSAI
eukprot:CAMPEP_0196153030 /NCGR_PEP_ID=MMETSP0910-20130528/36507_1 /TAXON_ID=49265 /ORGANISM="Thalassiosira rotula, Strain GSO102" /LENGTH=81 /DNA_ID=CAMNT_0041416749 /DNA_START=136 /DNA_END=382 /DNA_ORIENTATION=+